MNRSIAFGVMLLAALGGTESESSLQSPLLISADIACAGNGDEVGFELASRHRYGLGRRCCAMTIESFVSS
ncbi:MAG: hypothetical protein U0V87_06915 [Acidobacteriota bacterium]